MYLIDIVKDARIPAPVAQNVCCKTEFAYGASIEKRHKLSLRGSNKPSSWKINIIVPKCKVAVNDAVHFTNSDRYVRRACDKNYSLLLVYTTRSIRNGIDLTICRLIRTFARHLKYNATYTNTVIPASSTTGTL